MTAPNLRTILRARLRALLELHGYTPTSAGRALGSHTRFLRKLRDDRDPRPLLVADLEAALDLVGEPHTRILAPVLLAGDLDVLRCAAASDLFDPVTLDRALIRLSEQGLLTVAEDGAATLTAEGRALLED